MSATRVNIGDDKKTMVIRVPKVTNDTFHLLLPELHGKDEHAPFAVQEVLRLKEAEKDARLKFELAGNASELGVEFKGSLSAGDGEVTLNAKLRNLRSEPIHYGHHTVLLDFGEALAFDDRTGERTFLYAETGWTSVSQLLDPMHTRQHTIHVGASHKSITVMWKMIARFDATRRIIVALALDKGYVFASDHEDWGRGLLGGYRWGSVNPQETKMMMAKVYIFRGTLDDLRKLYMKDFK